MEGFNSRRRTVLLAGAAVCVGAMLPGTVLAAPAGHKQSRTLAIRSINTGEKLEIRYYDGSCYIPDAVQKLNNICRDHRRDVATEMDVKLFDQLYAIQDLVGSRQEITMVSGYRSPATNEMLRGAKKSYHMKGQAMDFSIEGVQLSKLRNAALSLKAGGVGYYPRSGFVHIDTGPVRSW